MSDTDAFLAQIARVSESNWTVSMAEDGQVRWLPLVAISKSGLWLGIEQSGTWALGRIGGNVVASTVHPPQAWLTILDSEESAFRSQLAAAAAAKYGLSEEILAERLPIDDVLAMALAEPSDHWSGRAVAWLNARGVHERHIDLLDQLTSARWASQRTRQAAARLVRRNA